MARHAIAIIGAGFGDEGKGLATDAHADERTTVVRANGGGQAGHTVRRRDGRSHVFHHVGAGSLSGATTHLAQRFVSNPLLLLRELDHLGTMGVVPQISADPRGMLTTPWDMMLNRGAERTRSASRHGSCGLGFGESIERDEIGSVPLRIGDLVEPDLRDKLEHIRTCWAPRRAEQLGIDPSNAELRWLDDGRTVDRFLEDCAVMMTIVRIVSDADAAADADRIVFEGAQGLELDMDYGAMPHVTRSNTGLSNVVEFALEGSVEAIDAIFMTRAYRTRHGAGPLVGEVDRMQGLVFEDTTNAENDWQGRIRLAPLDVPALRRAVHHDLNRNASRGVAINPSMGVTCLDQIEDRIVIMTEDGCRPVDADRLLAAVSEGLGLPVALRSYGPDRESVVGSQFAPSHAPSS